MFRRFHSLNIILIMSLIAWVMQAEAQDFLKEFEGVYTNKVTCRNGTKPEPRILEDERVGMYADGRWWNSYYVGKCLAIVWGDFEKLSSTKIRYRSTGGCKSCGISDIADNDWVEEEYTITPNGLTFSTYSVSECRQGPFVFNYTRIISKPPPFDKIVKAGCSTDPVPLEQKRVK